MFENDWEESPATSWSHLITQKRQSFKLQIRNRQIDNYKNSVREKYNLIINYSNPQSSTTQIKLAIAKKQFKLTYIMNIVSNMMTNFNFCRIIAKQKIIEMLLIAITDTQFKSNENMEFAIEQKNQLIQTWVDLMILTTQNWSDLWVQLYQSSTQILWTIAVEYFSNEQICIKIRNLLYFFYQKFSIQNCLQDEDLIFFFKQQLNLCPIILQIVGQHMNLKIQQTLHNNNLIISNSKYLDTNEHSNYYIYLLSKIGFVDKQILQLLFKKLCENKVFDKRLAIRVLFQQMYFTQDQPLKIEQLDNQCKQIVYQLLRADI